MASLGPTDSSIHTFTTDRQRRKNLKGFARENRREPTLAEAQLWQALRTNQLGPRFRRQHAIEDYIVDFVCLSAWLVVEVDGEIHQVPEETEYDGGRTHALQERGFLVVRYRNEAVLQATRGAGGYRATSKTTAVLTCDLTPRPPLLGERGSLTSAHV